MDRSVTNPTKEITRVPQLRISLTVPCGKRCVYCRPGGEGFVAPRSREMTTEQIVTLTGLLVRHGVRDVKLTGGEPMFRRDIVEIIRGIRQFDGVRSLHLVTRHHKAGDLAAKMKDAGLDVLNFSVDSLDPHTWSAITGVKGHERLVAAVYKAAASGITLKLNTVVMAGVNAREIPALIEFAGEFGAQIKFLDLIDDIQGFDDHVGPDESFDLDDVTEDLEGVALESDIDFQPGGLGHPMPRFKLENGATVVIKSSNEGAWYGEVCEGCRFFPCHDALMAVRLTADGKLQYCLLREDNLVDLRGMLDAGASEAELDAVAEQALAMYGRARFYQREELAELRAKPRFRPLPVLSG
jgi:cyclic pyranopterin phosphate synthase